MSQDSDDFLTPKRTSKLSRSNNRRIQNLIKNSDSESCSISQDSTTPTQSKGTYQLPDESITTQSPMSDNEEYLRCSNSSSGTCSVQGESSITPTEKQKALRTRKTMGKKQAELSSQSDIDELPSPLYVPLFKSPPIVNGTPAASTYKAQGKICTYGNKIFENVHV